MDGILVIDKPAGMTSHDVVAAVRLLAGEKRVGHAGTLDPMATGVLPVLIGRATKVSDFLMRGDKGYAGTFTFGIGTDTLDVTGKVEETVDASALSESHVRTAALRFTGPMEQTPPLYSAIKVKGRALHKSARRGLALDDPPPRPIVIRRFDITGWRSGAQPEADFDLACSKGTYVRSLARDLGRAVGLPGVLAALRRTKSGVFDLMDAIPLAELDSKNLLTYLRPIRTGLAGFPAITVSAAQVAGILNGGGLVLSGQTEPTAGEIDSEFIVLGPAGETLAVHTSVGLDATRPIRVIGEGSL